MSATALILATSGSATAPSFPGKFVFATAGDETDRLEIAMIDSSTGRIRKLTNHAVAGFSPTWREDGHIWSWTEDSFTGRNRLWRMTSRGRGMRQVLAGYVSPSGRRTALFSGDARWLEIYDARGRRLRRLRVRFGPNDILNTIPKWSADDLFVAFSIWNDGERTDTVRTVVFRADRRGEGRVITKTRNGYSEDPLAWSKKGHRLYLMTEVDRTKKIDLYVVTPSGRRLGRIRTDFARAWGERAFSLAPDDRRVAFVTKGGSIVVARLRGGPAKVVARLRDGRRAASRANLEWSPKGRELAYSERDGIYVVRSNGASRRRVTRLGAYGFPSWSPDSARITFSVGSDRVYVVGSNGRGLRRLTTAVWDDSPRWSPDGSRVAFLRGPHGLEDARATSIFVMDADGRGQRRLGRGYDPHWNPDGSSVVFVDAGAGRIVIATDGRPPVTVATGTDPEWSPDGRRLAFMRYALGRSTLYLVESDGTGLRELVSTDESSCEAHLWDPAWSADGRTIALVAFSVRDLCDGPRGLAFVDVDAPARWRLVGLGFETPFEVAWAPDSSQVAFRTLSAMYTMRPDGSAQTRISGGLENVRSTITWSPDSKWVGFIGCVDDRFSDADICDVYIGRPDGSALEQITKTRGMERAPHWWAPPGP